MFNIQKAFAQRSGAPRSGWITGRGGRQQREADGQHSVGLSMAFAALLLEAQKGVAVGPKKEGKKIETHQYSEEQTKQIY